MAKAEAEHLSSIFLVARTREETDAGAYEEGVGPELERIIRERVETLWDFGIVGADLIIAGLGAGLRAFTRFERVEYANGELAGARGESRGGQSGGPVRSERAVSDGWTG